MRDITKMFNKELSLIHSESIQTLTRKALHKCPKQFFTESMSDFLNYGEVSGLVKQTKLSVNLAVILAKQKTLGITTEDTDFDYVISALILKDCCQNGVPWTQVIKRTHPLLVSGILERAYLTDTEYIDWLAINELIKVHEGSVSSRKGQPMICPTPKTMLQHFVALCSYLSKTLESISIPEINVDTRLKNKTSSAVKSTVPSNTSFYSKVDKIVKNSSTLGWRGDKCTVNQIKSLESWIKKSKTKVPKDGLEYISHRISLPGLTKGEASELIGLLKLEHEGTASIDQIKEIEDLIRVIRTTAHVIPTDLESIEQSLLITDGLSRVRAEKIIFKLKQYTTL